MPTKTTIKKTARTKKSPQTVKKPAKRITQADIEANFARMQKFQDEAWQAIRELQQGSKEMQQGYKELRQGSKEMQKAVKETQKNIGGVGRTLGSLVEHILTPDLPQKFKKLGYSFNRIARYRYSQGVYAEVDGMLENGTLAVVVEVKTTLREIDIDRQLERMEKIKKYADENGDKRQFMGAIASTITDDPNRNYALNRGLFVIEPSGEDVKVTKPAGEPRVW